MEFLDQSLINTSTVISVDSGTAQAANIITRDETLQWTSDGSNNDNTITTLTITFSATSPVARIGMVGINWRDFTVFHSGVTANTLAITSTAATSSSDWSANSSTAMYLKFSTVQASSISFDINKTIVANSEKAIGYLHISDTKLVFDRVPSSKDYKPVFNPKQVLHKLSDGSHRIHEITRNYQTKIKFKYLAEATKNTLFDIWKEQSEFVFVAFGTSTSWDEVIYPVIWPGKFDFFKYSADATDSGFTGQIDLKETTS